jgi:hypothetical protein
MGEFEVLYKELKADFENVADPLISASTLFLRNRGAFLPHGATLLADGEVRLIMAVPPDFETRAGTAYEVLPLLHQSLRKAATESHVVAVAACEDVRITIGGKSESPAIKVLIEHVRGLTAAFYLPYSKRLFRGYRFGDMILKSVAAEVQPWPGT